MALILQDICLLFICLFYAVALECDINSPCLGRRPRINGCCPLLAGEECDSDGKRQCDKSLGYNCTNGFCRGKYSLTAIDIGTSSVELTWRDFIPENYKYEYSVMFTLNVEEELENWERHEFGIEPHVTLKYLNPDEWYFIRVGVWDEPEMFTFIDLTETLMVKTKAADHCVYGGNRVTVWEAVVIECQESCVCLPTGQFRCVEVCPRGDVETPVCTDLSDEYCCDIIESCITAEDCSYENGLVSHGHSWLIGCLENCTCHDGDVTCKPVCEEIVDPSHCEEEEFRDSTQDCCRNYLECIKEEELEKETPDLMMKSETEKSETTNKLDQTAHENNEEFNSNIPNKLFSSSTVKPLLHTPATQNSKIVFSVERIAATFAVLKWSIRNDILLRNHKLIIKYRALSDFVWAYTEALHANSTQCIAKCLKQSSWYIAELLTLSGSKSLGVVFFNTTKLLDFSDFKLQPTITAMEINSTSIHINWKPAVLWNHSDILYIEIFWTNIPSSDILSQTCIDKNTSDISIINLTPETVYVFWIGVILRGSKVVYSNQIHFVTAKASGDSSSFFEHSKIIAIAISCTSVVILFLTFSTVTYIVRYRRRRSLRRPQMAFENKIFQIN